MGSKKAFSLVEFIKREENLEKELEEFEEECEREEIENCTFFADFIYKKHHLKKLYIYIYELTIVIIVL